MKRLTTIAILLALTGCKTPADSDADPEAEATEETVEKTAEESTEEPTEAAPKVAEAEPAAFTPVKIPGTPHDEEGTSVTLTWAADSGEVGLYKSIGVPSKATARIKLEKGAELDYEDSVVLVTEGTALTAAREGVALTGATHFASQTGAHADGSRDEAVAAGDKVWMLKYAGEGTCYMQLNDKVYLANCPNDEFEEHDRKAAASEWWVMMKGDGGSGWLNVDDRVKVETTSSM